MNDCILVKKYAKFLLKIAEKHKLLNELESNLKYFLNYIDKNDDEFDKLMKNPIFTINERKKIILIISKELKLNFLIFQFLNLLIERNKFYLLSLIANYIFKNLDILMTRTRVLIISSKEFIDKDLKLLIEKISINLRKKILPTMQIDKGIIGGVKIIVNDLILEKTVISDLANLEKELKLSF